MTTKNNASQCSGVAAREIDLMPYVSALMSGWWLMLLLAVAGAGLSAWTAWSTPYMYESTARVNIIDIEDPGGVSPDDRRASEVITLVEHGFVMGTTRDNYADVIRARLNSRDYTIEFLNNNNVYRYFYPEQWDELNGRWLDGFKPDVGQVFTRFRDEVKRIDRNEETGILTVSMVWPEPKVARDWANAYVSGFNKYMRARTMQEVESKQAFLEEELRRSDVLEIRQSLFRLIEAQTAIAMLASAREEYALEVIDPAALPYRSFNMSRKKKTVFGGVAGILIASFLVMAFVFLKNIVQKIIQYRREMNDASVQFS